MTSLRRKCLSQQSSRNVVFRATEGFVVFRYHWRFIRIAQTMFVLSQFFVLPRSILVAGMLLASVSFARCQAPCDLPSPTNTDPSLLAKATAAGATAQFIVGRQHSTGPEQNRDYGAAARWFCMAAQEGYAGAESGLAELYDSGQGVQQDYRLASFWYKRAAQQGYPEAQFQLGQHYHLGRGVQRDDSKARFWNTKAAAGGNSAAIEIWQSSNEKPGLPTHPVPSTHLSHAHRATSPLRDRAPAVQPTWNWWSPIVGFCVAFGIFLVSVAIKRRRQRTTVSITNLESQPRSNRLNFDHRMVILALCCVLLLSSLALRVVAPDLAILPLIGSVLCAGLLLIPTAAAAITGIGLWIKRFLVRSARCSYCVRNASCSFDAHSPRQDQVRDVRNHEVTRLSKAWLSRSESYFHLNPYEFEDAIAHLFSELGYKVKQTPYSNDGGKDMILWKGRRKYVVECKRYEISRVTGRPSLQILLAAKHDEGADEAFFVTTGKFTRNAREYAEKNGIHIYDGSNLHVLVNRAPQNRRALRHAAVMCDVCGEVVHFDLAERRLRTRKCRNEHEVNCNIMLDDLSVAAARGSLLTGLGDPQQLLNFTNGSNTENAQLDAKTHTHTSV